MTTFTKTKGNFAASAVAQTVSLLEGERYALMFHAGGNFNSETITPAIQDADGNLTPLPTPGSADSAGSPQAFAAEGMIEFVALGPALVLTPSGAVTDVDWTVTRINHQNTAR